MPRPSPMMIVMCILFVIGLTVNAAMLFSAVIFAFIVLIESIYERVMMKEIFYPDALLERDIAYINEKIKQRNGRVINLGVKYYLVGDIKKMYKKWKRYDEVSREHYEALSIGGFMPYDVQYVSYADKFARFAATKGVSVC